ncbi:hypothetical protein L208DRAFT_1538367, partial [Tricholoma matsutake]
CKVSYYHNYYVKGGHRHYYTSQLCIIEAGKHQFVKQKVVDMWIDAMVISHTSTTNCACLYHCSFSHNNIPPSGWPVGFTLTTKHMWDAFVIACLLDDSSRLSSQLVVPNAGLQKDQFMEAMKAWNLHLHLYSQPELSHQCDKLTVGHPCCAVYNCFDPLENQCNHFCMSHEMTEGRVCMIKGWTQLREAQTRICSDPDHIEAERICALWYHSCSTDFLWG